MNNTFSYPNWCGPSFGSSDLKLSVPGLYSTSTSYNFNICKQEYYEKKIRDTEDEFNIEEYEVFQLIRN
ncbi:hypothetical protein RhiirC2_762254 [Rhizophagus irregularis]|uniref:TLDc domain-containing protein n=1 Tax=Rhizophagus irregularis TaxID=588596 RepID=A0A2N1ME66_9GLOM|nr:hypothetical protein RhiirC2_762254 [Rhizophagus irregularis]